VTTLEAAKAAFRDSYDKWRAGATKAGFDSSAGWSYLFDGATDEPP